jgi:hypothetical protein
LEKKLLRKALFSMVTSLTATRVALSTMTRGAGGQTSKTKVKRTDLVKDEESGD